jgi:hypothetical protein
MIFPTWWCVAVAGRPFLISLGAFHGRLDDGGLLRRLGIGRRGGFVGCLFLRQHGGPFLFFALDARLFEFVAILGDFGGLGFAVAR